MNQKYYFLFLLNNINWLAYVKVHCWVQQCQTPGNKESSFWGPLEQFANDLGNNNKKITFFFFPQII